MGDGMIAKQFICQNDLHRTKRSQCGNTDALLGRRIR
jgi:hypothetical protein